MLQSAIPLVAMIHKCSYGQHVEPRLHSDIMSTLRECINPVGSAWCLNALAHSLYHSNKEHNSLMPYVALKGLRESYRHHWHYIRNGCSNGWLPATKGKRKFLQCLIATLRPVSLRKPLINHRAWNPPIAAPPIDKNAAPHAVRFYALYWL